MRPNRPSFVVEEEKKLIEKRMSMSEDITIEELIERYASKKYKDYLKEKKCQEDALWEQGIIVN